MPRVDENEIVEEHEEQGKGNDKLNREYYDGYDSQVAWQQDLRDYMDDEICGARNNKHQMCGNRPSKDSKSGRCKFHGGHANKGLAHSQTKHGRYSKYLPDELREKYEEAESDEELLSLRSEISLITSRLFELAEKVEQTAGKVQIDELLRMWNKIKKHENNPQRKTMWENRFEKKIKDIEEDRDTWEEIDSLVDTKRKLIDSEQKKLENLEQFVPTEQVMLFVGAVMDIVKTEIEGSQGAVLDEDTKSEIISGISRRVEKLSEGKKGV